MRLVDNIYPIFALAWRIDRLFPKLAHIIHAIVARRVNLYHVKRGPQINIVAGFTLHTRISVNRVLAVHRHREDFRAGGFACSARTGKQVRVRRFASHDFIFQCRGNMRLANNIFKCFGTRDRS